MYKNEVTIVIMITFMVLISTFFINQYNLRGKSESIGSRESERIQIKDLRRNLEWDAVKTDTWTFIILPGSERAITPEKSPK